MNDKIIIKEYEQICSLLPGLTFNAIEDKCETPVRESLKEIKKREDETTEQMRIVDLKLALKDELHWQLVREHDKLKGNYSFFHKGILFHKILKDAISKEHQYTIACDNKKIKEGVVQGEPVKIFASFNNWDANYDHLLSKTVKEKDLREFYEVIEEHHKRKPYFDIDMKDNFDLADDLIQNMLTAIKFEMLTRTDHYDHENTCIFTSHDEKKKSFHIIINGYYFENNEQMTQFFNNVVKRLPKKYKDQRGLLDASVYHRNAMFRMYQSHKMGTKERKYCLQNIRLIIPVP